MDFLIDTLLSEFDGEIRFSPWGYKSITNSLSKHPLQGLRTLQLMALTEIGSPERLNATQLSGWFTLQTCLQPIQK